MKHLGVRISILLALDLSTIAILVLLGLLTGSQVSRAASYTVCLEGLPACDYTSIQAAVDAANDGDVIKVASGTYTDVNSYGGLTQIVYISKSVTIRGGYTTAFTDPPDPKLNLTTLDAEGWGRVLYITSPSAGSGQAISPIVEGLRLTGGDAAGQGGGVFADSNLTLVSTEVVDNAAGGDGGGAYVSGDLILTGGRFENNRSDTDGGGLFLRNGDLIITATHFIRNSANDDGGGLYHGGDDGRVLNALFARNSASRSAGLHLDGTGVVDLVHTTFANATLYTGRAIFVNQGTARITNTLIANYTAGIGARSRGDVYEDYNLFFNVSTPTSGATVNSGDHSFVGDPAFRNPTDDDYRLTYSSAAIDSGTDVGVRSDFEGEPRPAIGGFDIGFDEFPAALVVTKQADPDPVQPGARLTFTIRVTNTGVVDLHAIVTDTLPSQITSGQASGTTLILPGGVVTWTPVITSAGVGAPGGVWEETVVVTVETGYFGPLVNVVEVATEEGARGVYTETSTPMGALWVTKQASSDLVPAGAQLTYTLRVTNTGFVDLHAIVTDTLPSHILSGRTSGGTVVLPGEKIAWTPIIPPTRVGAPGGVWIETVVVTIETGYSGALSNRVDVTTLEGVTDVFTATSQVLGIPLNRAPYTPANPVPANGAGNVSITQTLSWQGGDPDRDLVTYTLAFGPGDPPPFAATTTLTRYTPTLISDTVYYWLVTATDGISTSVGPLWHFSTLGPVEYPVYLPLVLRGGS